MRPQTPFKRRRSPAHLDAAARVRAWTRARFALSADAPIVVLETACGLPGCPPLETVVAFWVGKTAHRFKVFKPVGEVVPADLPPAWLRTALAAAQAPDGCC